MVSQVLDPLDAVRLWVNRVVVGLDLCPFAARVVDAPCCRWILASGGDAGTADHPMLVVGDEVAIMESSSRIETSLIVLDHNAWLDFDAYLSLVESIEDWLQATGYEQNYQLASFHPDYQFAGTDPDDIENYTNRSPFPVLHLLKESSVTEALMKFRDPDGIPKRNVETMRNLGLTGLQALLNCSTH